MADPNIATSRLIGVETPSTVLPFLNCFADVLVVADLDTFILLQSTSAPHLATACNDIGSSVRVTVRGVRRWSRRTLSCVCAHEREMNNASYRWFKLRRPHHETHTPQTGLCSITRNSAIGPTINSRPSAMRRFFVLRS